MEKDQMKQSGLEHLSRQEEDAPGRGAGSRLGLGMGQWLALGRERGTPGVLSRRPCLHQLDQLMLSPGAGTLLPTHG